MMLLFPYILAASIAAYNEKNAFCIPASRFNGLIFDNNGDL
jgi:hypothetical protein